MTQKVCVKCQLEMRCKENGVAAITVDQNGKDLELWDADLWVCPGCEYEAVLGFGRHPITEHFQSDFREVLASYPTKVRFWLNEREKQQAQANDRTLNTNP